MKQIDFYLDEFDQILKMREGWLSKKPGNNVMSFDETVGDGSSFFKELEPGLYVDTWDVVLNEDTRAVLHPSKAEAPIIYNVNFLLTTDSYLVEMSDLNSGQIRKVNIINNMIMHTNRTGNFSYIIKGGQRAKALDVYFSQEWLMNQFPARRKAEIMKILFQGSEEVPIYLEPIAGDSQKVITEVINRIASDDWDVIFLKSRIMGLMSNIIGSLFSQRQKHQDMMESGKVPVMMEVEMKLNSVLNDRLPKLKVIANQFAMSESTLKRQFREDYGSGIYEYYLRKKMELAHRMIIENDRTVSQVAYSLGYEKAGSFIKAFKKQFGVSPRGLRLQG